MLYSPRVMDTPADTCSRRATDLLGSCEMQAATGERCLTACCSPARRINVDRGNCRSPSVRAFDTEALHSRLHAAGLHAEAVRGVAFTLDLPTASF